MGLRPGLSPLDERGDRERAKESAKRARALLGTRKRAREDTASRRPCERGSAPSLAPKNKSSVYLEVSNWHKKNISDNSIKLLARKFLKNMKIIKKNSEIEVEQINKVKYGYVIFDKNYKLIKNKALNYLEKNNVYSVGRYGLWKYSSMEDSMLDGLKVNQKLKKF